MDASSSFTTATSVNVPPISTPILHMPAIPLLLVLRQFFGRFPRLLERS
jgi:hypothetical protein